MLNEGPRLVYGMSTFLVACYAVDLSIEERSSGNCVIEWTRPAGVGSDPKTLRALEIGRPLKRRLVFKGCWHSGTKRLPAD